MTSKNHCELYWPLQTWLGIFTDQIFFYPDSQEESDEISNEFEFVHQISEESMPNTSNPDLNNPRNESKKFQSFEKIMEQVKTSSNRSEQVSLLATMIKVLKQDPTSQESYGDAKKLFQAFQVK